MSRKKNATRAKPAWGRNASKRRHATPRQKTHAMAMSASNVAIVRSFAKIVATMNASCAATMRRANNSSAKTAASIAKTTAQNAFAKITLGSKRHATPTRRFVAPALASNAHVKKAQSVAKTTPSKFAKTMHGLSKRSATTKCAKIMPASTSSARRATCDATLGKSKPATIINSLRRRHAARTKSALKTANAPSAKRRHVRMAQRNARAINFKYAKTTNGPIKQTAPRLT